MNMAHRGLVSEFYQSFGLEENGVRPQLFPNFPHYMGSTRKEFIPAFSRS